MGGDSPFDHGLLVFDHNFGQAISFIMSDRDWHFFVVVHYNVLGFPVGKEDLYSKIRFNHKKLTTYLTLPFQLLCVDDL